jgi:hypothetical protein
MYPVSIKGEVFIEASSEVEAESKIQSILYEYFPTSDVKVGFEVTLILIFEIIGVVGMFALISVGIWVVVTLITRAGV